MSRIITFNGLIQDKHEINEVESGKKIKDYVCLKNYDFDNTIIFVNGYKQNKDYVLKDNDVCAVRQMEGTVAAGVIGGIIAVAAVTASINPLRKKIEKGLNNLADVINGTTTNDTTSEYQQVSTIPTLSGGRNSSQYDSVVPFVMGRHLYTPKYIVKPYTTISGTDGENEYYHCLFLLGYNSIQATDFKLGNLVLSPNTAKTSNGSITVGNGSDVYYKEKSYETKLEIRDTGEVTMIPQKVVQEDFDVELLNKYYPTDSSGNYEQLYYPLTKFSALYPQKVEVEFSISGLIAYTSSSKKNELSINIAVEYSKDGGTTWLPFGQIGVGQSNITYNEDGTKYGTVKGTTYKGASHITRTKAKQMRFVATKTFSYSEVMNSDGCSLTDNCIQIRVTRISPSYQSGIDNGVSGFTLTSPSDTIYLSSIRTYCFDPKQSLSKGSLVAQSPLISSLRDRTTRVGFCIKATEDMNGSIDSFNCVVQSKGRIWDKDTQTWSDKDDVSVTRNPASIALLALQSVMRGDSSSENNYAYEDSKLDLDSFGAFYEWCDERGYYNSSDTETIRFSCDGVLTSQKKTSDILTSILACGRGSLILIGKKYGVFIDKPRDNPVMILNNQNLLSRSNSKDFEDIPDRYEVQFVDEKNNWTEDTGYAYMDESKRDTDDGTLLTQSATMSYMTNWYQVWANLRYLLACKKLRPETWTAKIGVEGNLLDYGDLVEVQDDTLLIGIGDGAQITELVYDEDKTCITGIKTDGDFIIDDSSLSYGVKIMCSDYSNGGTPALLKRGVTFDGTTHINDFTFDNTIPIDNEILPCVGDILSFGIYDKVSTLSIVTEKKPDEEGHFELTLVPYVEDVYTADKSVTVPEFESNMTAPIRSASNNKVTLADLEEIQSKVNENTNNQVSEIIEGTKTLGDPDTPVFTAYAEKDGIQLSCLSFGEGLRNSIASVVWYLKKCESEDDNTTEWENIGRSTSTSYFYNFDRDTDGYPERDDFSLWKVKCIAYNINNGSAESKTTSIIVSRYGTWQLQAPNVTVRVSERTVTLICSEPSRSDGLELYGSVKYQIQVRKPSTDKADTWYKPSTSADPYADENNYKDGDGGVTSDGVYVQTMPLTGQDSSNIIDTLYQFKVMAYNEVNTSKSTIVNATAICSSIRDLVKANETAKESYIENLTALCSAFGFISSGLVNGKITDKLNYWSLNSGLVENDSNNIAYKGAFRVGGDDEYILVKPIVQGGKIESYSLEFRVGNFNVTSTASTVNGEMIVMTSESSLDRTRITPSGTYFEHRETASSEWSIKACNNAIGLKSSQVYNDKQLYLSNQSQSQRRNSGYDIGNKMPSDNSLIYHFDTDLLNQNLTTDLTITDVDGNVVTTDITQSGYLSFKGDDDSLYVSGKEVDVTPAILSIAPYTLLGKGLCGQFCISETLSNVTSYTVDFWMQFLDSQKQTLFSIGSENDTLQLLIRESEIYYEMPYPYTLSYWIRVYSQVYTEDDITELYNNFIDEHPNCVPYNLDVTLSSTESYVPVHTFAMGSIDDGFVDEGYVDDSEVYPTKKWKNGTYYTLDSGLYKIADVTEDTWNEYVKNGLYEPSIVYNKPILEGQELRYKTLTSYETTVIDLSDLGFYENSWCHIGVISDDTKLKCYMYAYDANNELKGLSFEFTKENTDSAEVTIRINSDKIITIIDELLIDRTTAESKDDFIAHSTNRIPFGTLNKDNSEDIMVLSCANPEKFYTNIFESTVFKNAVQNIIDSQES